MENNCKYFIQIETATEDEKVKLGNKIHEQLVGNKDYIDSNIVLNIDLHPRMVQVWIFDECHDIPEIRI